jgi:3-phosphoshikimate 1-carboxyvinyltransferase
MDQKITPIARDSKKIEGAIRPRGDKSISHRALILAAMASGDCRLTGVSIGADVNSTATALGKLGVEVKRTGEITHVSSKGWPPDIADGSSTGNEEYVRLDAGNSATTMRLLMGALSSGGSYELLGDPSLTGRPMDPVAEPLRAMGASVELAESRYPPVKLRGGPLTGIHHEVPLTSAQVKGSLLLAGIQATGSTSLIEKHPTRDHTERLLEWLGVDIVLEGNKVVIEETNQGLPLPRFDLDIPGDISSAAYMITAAVLSKSSSLEVSGVGLSPYRGGLLQTLKKMGADISWHIVSADPEPQGEVFVRSSDLQPVAVGGAIIPTAIDEISLIALAATQAHGTTHITNAEELRIKESDRIEVITRQLSILGAKIEATSDGMIVEGPTPLSGGKVDSSGDHRMAMTLAVAGLIATDEVIVSSWESVNISYPEFLADLEEILR